MAEKYVYGIDNLIVQFSGDKIIETFKSIYSDFEGYSEKSDKKIDSSNIVEQFAAESIVCLDLALRSNSKKSILKYDSDTK